MNGFIDAIIAAPDDDSPRLACADWLDEHGEPARAEFIRVQVELARGCPAEWRFDALRRRERELYPLCIPAAWDVDLASLRRAAYRRGFVEVLTLPLADWHLHAEELLRSAPLRELNLTDWWGSREAHANPRSSLTTVRFARPDGSVASRWVLADGKWGLAIPRWTAEQMAQYGNPLAHGLGGIIAPGTDPGRP